MPRCSGRPAERRVRRYTYGVCEIMLFSQSSIIVNIVAAVGALEVWLTSFWLIYNLSLAFYNVLERFLLVFGTLVISVCAVGIEFCVFGIIEAFAEEFFVSRHHALYLEYYRLTCC